MTQTHAEHQRTYRRKHPDRAKESTRRYRETHADLYAATVARWKLEHPESVAKYRAKYKASYYERHPERKVAEAAVYYAVRSGSVSRGLCDVCGATESIQAHHHDYDRPLDVRWLCYEHHQSLHRGTP